jgi:hypothetical protein
MHIMHRNMDMYIHIHMHTSFRKYPHLHNSMFGIVLL